MEVRALVVNFINDLWICFCQDKRAKFVVKTGTLKQLDYKLPNRFKLLLGKQKKHYKFI